jgi:hypothetical protein
MPDTTTTRPLDAERERLRAKGYDDDFIREYLLRKEMQEQAQAQQPAAPTGAGGVAPQGMYSQVLGSCVAVLGYIKDSLAAIPNHYGTLRDAQATAKEKRDAGAALIVKLALTGLLIFGAGMEFIKFTIYEVEIAAAQAQKTAAEATSAQIKACASATTLDARSPPGCDALFAAAEAPALSSAPPDSIWEAYSLIKSTIDHDPRAFASFGATPAAIITTLVGNARAGRLDGSETLKQAIKVYVHYQDSFPKLEPGSRVRIQHNHPEWFLGYND